MDVVHPRCCGLDVHKQLIVACVLRSAETGRAQKEVRTFGTMNDQLPALGLLVAQSARSSRRTGAARPAAAG